MSTTTTTTLLTIFLFIATTSAQSPIATAPAPAPSPDLCNGIWISYRWISGKRLHPKTTSPTEQPYSFKSQLTVLNNDDVELKSWQVSVGFQHDELLVSLDGAIIANGSSLPALVGNGTIFAGFPMTDLKTAIQTAGNVDQTTVGVSIEGTQFGVATKVGAKSPKVPLPNNISLVNEGYVCPEPFKIGNFSLNTCCYLDPDLITNMTVTNEDFLARKNGDLTIMYDVIRTYPDNYWAEVTMANHNPLGRLDYWKLSWDWMYEEFINDMKGAYPDIVDANDCIDGPQAKHYAGLDFSKVLNCYRSPTIIDLPPQYAQDPTLGMVPFCCRNGTILPAEMNETKSVSKFQIQVYKMPPNTNITALNPPENWKISGELNPDYVCGPPVRVSPSEFPSPTGLTINTTAFASWQVVCNITKPKNASPKCCVSYSAFFNDSVIPCNTCACGCPKKTDRTCSTTAPALLLPPEAQLIPFDNRTKLSLSWAEIQHRPVPNPLPCSDNCGVSINWHLASDYNKGWSAKITLFNWQETIFPEWFVAIEMDNAAPGFEKVYSFNGTLMGKNNDTIFMQGLPGLNYLMGETNGTKPTDPRVPGKQQSVISFTKKFTPGIQVSKGDGFPTKLYFNGEECSLPDILPINGGYLNGPVLIFPLLLALLALIFLQQ